MSMTSFKAGTQYGDWKGTAAADEHGADSSFEELFEATGKVKENEVLIAFEFYAGEGTFFLAGYFHPKSDSNPDGWGPSLNDDFNSNADPIKVKQVRVELTLEKFFRYFKRFNVVLIARSLNISGRDYKVSETDS